MYFSIHLLSFACGYFATPDTHTYLEPATGIHCRGVAVQTNRMLFAGHLLMTKMNAQQDINKILKDFEVGAQRYQNHEIDLSQLSQLEIRTRLADHVANVWHQGRVSEPDKLNAEEISGTNVELLRSALRRLVSRLTDSDIDPLQEMDLMVRHIIRGLCSYIPDRESDGIAEFLGFYYDKCIIDDISDPAEKSRRLEDLSRRVREAASEYLQSGKVEPKD